MTYHLSDVTNIYVIGIDCMSMYHGMAWAIYLLNITLFSSVYIIIYFYTFQGVIVSVLPLYGKIKKFSL